MFDKLFSSFTGIDAFILGIAIITAFVLVYCLNKAKVISRYVDEWKRTKNTNFTSYVHDELAVAYNLFLTLISIFPLLGMFGTVMGLLNVDFSAGNMDDVKANFFTALTSTAWGIIYSVGFKVVNAFYSNRIETQIDDSKKLAEIIGPKRSKKSR